MSYIIPLIVVVCNRAGWDENQTDFKYEDRLHTVQIYSLDLLIFIIIFFIPTGTVFDLLCEKPEQEQVSYQVK